MCVVCRGNCVTVEQRAAAAASDYQLFLTAGRYSVCFYSVSTFFSALFVLCVHVISYMGGEEFALFPTRHN